MWWLSVVEKNKKWERENQEPGTEILSTATWKQSLKEMKKMMQKTRKEHSRQQQQEVQKFWGRSVYWV